MKIAFLLDNAYGIGGTIRSTVNLSRALAVRHTVEVVSLRRPVTAPALAFDARVTLTPLMDLRTDSPHYDGTDPLYHQPSERFAERPSHFERGLSTRLGDLRMAAYLRDTDADMVIATRPKLVDYLACYGSDRYLRAGQEHLTRRMHSEHVLAHQDAAIRQLDAFVTVSRADAADYRTAFPETPGGPRILCIPNPVPAPGVESSHGDTKLIVAAGRLVQVKRYDRLLEAFALVSEEHPDWQLRLYGRGKLQGELRARLNRLGLYNRAFLMGAHSPIESEWAKASIAAVSSDAESFGMTLVEAMHCGVPVVSTNCPHGPGEIVSHGRDGLLTPLSDDEQENVRAYADDLLHLIENPGLRQRMGLAARQKAHRYTPARTADEYERLITKLRGGRSGASPERSARLLTAGGPAGHPVPLPRLVSRYVRGLTAHSLQPVRHALRRVRPQPPHRPHTSAPPAPADAHRPSTRTRVDAEGGITIRLRASRVPDGASALLLRARNRDDLPEVRLPLPERSEAAPVWLQLRLDRSEHVLQEARWDAFVERGSDGLQKRVRSELVETARLLTSPPPFAPDGFLTPWVPYTTADGNLSVRAWRRPGHAEVTGVHLGPRGFTVVAELYGAAAGRRGWTVAAVPRREGDRSFELPLASLNADASPQSVSFELPYDLPAALDNGDKDTVWELRIRAEDGNSYRFGRLLGDLADRRKTDVLPTARLAGSGTGERLYFSLANDLTLALQPLRPEQPAGPDREEDEERRRTAGGTPGRSGAGQ